MLTELLDTNVFNFLLVFTRMGTGMIWMPGLSGQLIPERFRLLLALAITLVILPVVSGMLPPMPTDPGRLFLLLLGEATVGVFIGVVVQMLMVSLNLAATFIGFQVGLTNALVFDPVVEQQSSLLTGFMSNLAVVVMFATGMHHLMIETLVDSYRLFTPGQALPVGDLVLVVSQSLDDGFTLGVRLAAPLVVFGLVFYTALGLISKLAPQIPVFLVALPLQIIFGLSLLMMSLATLMALFLRSFEDGLIRFLSPG